MYYDFKVKIPEVKGKIYERTINGVVYINYEYDRIYKPDKKYNVPKRTTIGKQCEDDPGMMYLNITVGKSTLHGKIEQACRPNRATLPLC